MIEMLAALVGIVLGLLMVRHWRALATASGGPGLRGPGTTVVPARILLWFGYAIRAVGWLFVVGGVIQVVVLVLSI